MTPDRDGRDLQAWQVESARADWPKRVLERVRSYILELPTIGVISISIETRDLRVVYEQRGRDGLLGIRRNLTIPPPVGNPENDLADWLASWIATIEIAEPPGRAITTVPRDLDGVQWRELPLRQ